MQRSSCSVLQLSSCSVLQWSNCSVLQLSSCGVLQLSTCIVLQWSTCVALQWSICAQHSRKDGCFVCCPLASVLTHPLCLLLVSCSVLQYVAVSSSCGVLQWSACSMVQWSSCSVLQWSTCMSHYCISMPRVYTYIRMHIYTAQECANHILIPTSIWNRISKASKVLLKGFLVL